MNSAAFNGCFISVLKRLLSEKGVTQKQFLSDISININAVTDWKKNGNIPNGETLKRIAAYFDVSVDYLLGAGNDELKSTKNYDIKFSANLRRMRRSKHITQQELATYLGVKSAAISKYEKGIVSPSLSTIEGIATFLDVSVDDLLQAPHEADSGEPETASDISESAKLEFADRLKRALQAKRMKQVDVVEASKRYSKEYGSAISKSDMSQYLSGLHYPSSAKALILSAVLDVSPAWLLGLNGDTEPEESETESGKCDTAENKQIFSDNLRYYMHKNGISRQDLSNSLQIKYSTLCEWISAKKYPRIDSIEKIAGFFHITKSDLIEKRPVHIGEVRYR